MTLTLDNYPGETTWTWSTPTATTVFPAALCWFGLWSNRLCRRGLLHPDVFDSFGDGMCCAYGTGGYSFGIGDWSWPQAVNLARANPPKCALETSCSAAPMPRPATTTQTPSPMTEPATTAAWAAPTHLLQLQPRRHRRRRQLRRCRHLRLLRRRRLELLRLHRLARPATTTPRPLSMTALAISLRGGVCDCFH